MRTAGFILLEGIVTTNGDFQNVKVVRGTGNPLAPYALEAVRQWKFRSATKAGKPVAVIYHLTAKVHVR